MSLRDELPGVPEPDTVVVRLDLVRHLHLLQLRRLVLGLVVLFPPVLFVPGIKVVCWSFLVHSGIVSYCTLFPCTYIITLSRATP